MGGEHSQSDDGPGIGQQAPEHREAPGVGEYTRASSGGGSAIRHSKSLVSWQATLEGACQLCAGSP
jgi:hypothetical protein